MSEVASAQPEMTPQRWRQIRDLLAHAIRLPVEDRPTYVAKVCGGDFALRAELESLITAHEIAEGGAFEKPIIDITSAKSSDSRTPDRLLLRRSVRLGRTSFIGRLLKTPVRA
jgi:hypothetical protein